jgi:hypothetical protein
MKNPVINNDLRSLNLQFLMILRESARHHPIETIWQFNLNEEDVETISSMSIEDIKELASCGRAVLTILPSPARINAPLNIMAALLKPEVRQPVTEEQN